MNTKNFESKWTPGRIGIIGSGSWGTALAKIILATQPKINWYFRFKETVRQFKQLGHNPSYLTNQEFDIDRISFHTDIPRIVEESDTILLVTPSPYIKNVLGKLKPEMLKGKFFLNAIKGIVPEDNVLISDYLADEFDIPIDMIGAISGPCHAEEVALGRLSYLTVSCADIERACALQKIIEGPQVMCSMSDDVPGIEYASVLKNVYAIAAGICQGIRHGDNFQAVLISNAIGEMARFIDAAHPLERDIKGTEYLGDLLVTAYSRYSRNRTFGTMIGKGYSVKQAQLEMEMIAEGYYGTKCIHEVNKTVKAHIPIAEIMYSILYERRNPVEAIDELSKILS
ncbi:NAD(P)H-dependent glycerol-3-phosphate dehydrogenase [Porphyromonas sp.]|uniref:NAD(P)H-dependent glycerol-3-phosphate dehydrogenase n=1 Tax=Porphyromonas sp. TaxID=1924944 RepID=UPI0026DBD4A0|nr:NAD(P)H-dependent glycerol-3-phosphate dehydrogenase [Porphyromonas sp.]MDO4695148.1 glycerol-3-phosphate dehydrogenase [Porphyromonas sp.]MDO4770208.1 glycerol-3-phosphate dehydrogenase [Porphyromonas sp.]